MNLEARVPLRRRFVWILLERSRRGVWAWVVLLASLACLAATGRAVVDVLRWRDAGHLARNVAGNGRLTPQERIDAIVVMQRDGLEGLKLLQQIESAGGPLAAHARNARLAIEAAAKR